MKAEAMQGSLALGKMKWIIGTGGSPASWQRMCVAVSKAVLFRSSAWNRALSAAHSSANVTMARLGGREKRPLSEHDFKITVRVLLDKSTKEGEAPINLRYEVHVGRQGIHGAPIAHSRFAGTRARPEAEIELFRGLVEAR